MSATNARDCAGRPRLGVTLGPVDGVLDAASQAGEYEPMGVAMLDDFDARTTPTTAGATS